MAKRPTLRLSRSASHEAGRGSRPSKRGAVRTRGSVRAAPKGVVHVAMKRALRKGALRDCSQRCVY